MIFNSLYIFFYSNKILAIPHKTLYSIGRENGAMRLNGSDKFILPFLFFIFEYFGTINVEFSNNPIKHLHCAWGAPRFDFFDPIKGSLRLNSSKNKLWISHVIVVQSGICKAIKPVNRKNPMKWSYFSLLSIIALSHLLLYGYINVIVSQSTKFG